MSACQHRPEEGCLLTPCAAVTKSRRCLCGDEYRAESAEVREARVPDSARGEAGA